MMLYCKIALQFSQTNLLTGCYSSSGRCTLLVLVKALPLAGNHPRVVLRRARRLRPAAEEDEVVVVVVVAEKHILVDLVVADCLVVVVGGHR